MTTNRDKQNNKNKEQKQTHKKANHFADNEHKTGEL